MHAAIRDGAREGLRSSAPQIEREARSNALTRLPRRGGLAALVAAADMTVRTTGPTAVTVSTSSDLHLAGIDEGLVRHPTYGRGRFVNQQVPAAYLSDAVTEATPHVVDAVGDEVIARIKRAIR
jgi:hypothetical protein